MRGTVIDPAGAPVAGAVVAAVRTRPPSAPLLATSDAAGAFDFALLPADYAFTATPPAGLFAAHAPPVTLSASPAPAPVRLTLAATGVVLSGRVDAGGPAVRLPAGVWVHAELLGPGTRGAVYATRVGADGGYALRLPALRPEVIGVSLRAAADVDGSGAQPILLGAAELGSAGARSVDLHLGLPGPPPAAVVDWLRAAATPLSPAPDAPAAELAAFDRVVGDARVVAFGSSTLGTHEFFALEARLTLHLVTTRGFRHVVLVAPIAEAARLDDFVVHGTGSASEALAALSYRTWDNAELLALVTGLRAFNAGRPLADRVHLVGCDPGPAAEPADALDPFAARDAAQAAHVLALLDAAGPTSRAVLLGHAAHASREHDLLAARLGAGYRAIGFLFGAGRFTAGGTAIAPRGETLQPFALPAPAEANVATAFLRAGLESALVDLRAAPAGPVADWLAALHPVRDIGPRFVDEAGALAWHALARRYDAVVFVARTTASHPSR